MTPTSRASRQADEMKENGGQGEHGLGGGTAETWEERTLTLDGHALIEGRQ